MSRKKTFKRASHISVAQNADAHRFPAIERSAGKAFRDIPALAWIADDEVTPASAYIPLIAQKSVWVARIGMRPVGFLSAEQFGDELHLWQLAVESTFQRYGIGTRLLVASRQYCEQNKVNSITLTTFRGVPWNAPFYSNHGFVELAEHQQSRHLRSVLGGPWSRAS
ncbi:MAG: GNAT family N-acetyltransferase [Candidatus Eremiobacteraeota bacterium]|nr:GNAT family N-acetyltransferase [Candidatus Eremiobacteraeota bacterium]